jgi:hypothetical protein
MTVGGDSLTPLDPRFPNPEKMRRSMHMSTTNRLWTLAARPQGMPKEADFKLVEAPVGEPGEGEILVRLEYISVDPYMRRRMMDGPSYADPVQLGQLMVGAGVGKVLASRNPKFAEGDTVEGFFGWQTHALSNGRGVRKIDPKLAPVSTALYVLGMPGMTAYFGVMDICKPQAGETMLVSGAGGAVGTLVGQIAKIQGCRAVGIAGTDEKIDYIVNDLGFDAGYNYRGVKDHVARQRELCPDGIDSYFDNVGGEITDAAISLLTVGARVALCGQISQYNEESQSQGPRLLWQLITKQVKMEGFLVYQFASRWKEGLTQMAQWLQEGKLKYHEDIVEGIENTPSAFIGMLAGDNVGKRLIKLHAA